MSLAMSMNEGCFSYFLENFKKTFFDDTTKEQKFSLFLPLSRCSFKP